MCVLISDMFPCLPHPLPSLNSLLIYIVTQMLDSHLDLDCFSRLVNMSISVSILLGFATYCLLLVNVIAISSTSSSSSSDGTCPTWMYITNESSRCVCGVNLNKAIICNSSLKEIKVRRCHMISFDSTSNETVAGYSFYSCIEQFHKNSLINYYYPVPSNVSQINIKMCDFLNRGGLFCGACKEGYSPLVYSYKLNCTKCSLTDKEFIQNLFVFVAFAFIPATLFYLFVLFIKFNANSPCLHGFVLIAQLLTQTYSTKTLLEEFTNASHYVLYSVLTLQTLYSIWNLNFFRAFSPDICFRISTLSALSLEYVYPMLLIILTYVAIELHSRGFRIVIFVWRPFQLCSMYFRKEWNIKSSLIDVFATFLLLSYNRLLDISFSLLMYVTAYNPRGEAVGKYLYYDSSKGFFGDEHRPFGILAVVILFVCNLLPFLLLLFYPMKWFQKCLNCLRLSHVALHTFVDSFTGCYKDGTEYGTGDCRYFVAFFLLLRLANCFAISNTYDGYYFVVIIIIITIFSVIFISAQPYRSKFAHHNNTTMIFLLMAVMFCCCCYGLKFTKISRPQSSFSLLSFTFTLVISPQIYVLYLVGKWAYSRIPWYRLRLNKSVQLNDTVTSLRPHYTDCTTYNSI